MTSTAWKRVNRERRCPVCDHSDWCLVSADGGAAICARTESAKRCGNAGWLHRLTDAPWRPSGTWTRTISLTSTSTPSRDWSALAASYRAAVDPTQLDALAQSLGLSTDALLSLSIGWSTIHSAWSFPMVDPSGKTLGIRLRGRDGSKYAVTGSKDGLFIPADGLDLESRLLVCEGATDVAALFDLDFRAVVGRPSCSGGVKLLIDLVKRRRPAEVVVVADADESGQRGADNLAAVLLAYSQTVRVVVPKANKDVREFLRSGGTRKQLDAAILAAPVRRLTIKAKG